LESEYLGFCSDSYNLRLLNFEIHGYLITIFLCRGLTYVFKICGIKSLIS